MLGRKKEQPRNRQVSGTSRSPVFSYYNNRPADTATVKIKKRRRPFQQVLQSRDTRHHVRHIPTYIAVITIGISMLYATGLSVQPKIIIGQEKDGTRGLTRDQRVYEDALAAILRSSLLNRSKLTIDTSSVERTIEQKFPEIQSATVSIPLLGRRPIVGLDPATPALIYKSAGDAYVIAENGRALIPVTAAPASITSKLLTLEDKSNIRVEQGKGALPQESVTFITTLVQQFAAKNLQVRSFELPISASELRVNFSVLKYYGKFNLQEDALQQAGTFLAVRGKLDAQHVTPAEYIDVRVSERAYYK